MSGQIKVSAYGGNGPMTETFHYRIDGKKIHETVDIDLNSSTYGQTLSVKTKINGKLDDVSPNSELGLAVAHDGNGARQNSYLNEMDYISGKAEKAGFGNVHNEALKNSEMYNFANGSKPINKEIPAVEYTISADDAEAKEKEKVLEQTNETEATEREKSFVGLMQYPANAHYNDRSRPTQDHMKIDMFQYQAPQKNILRDYRGFNEGNKDGNVFANRAKDLAWGAGGATTLPLAIKDKTTRKTPQGAGANSRTDNQKFADIITGGLPRNTTLKKYLGTVKMPIPNQLRTANGVSWGEGRANAFEAASFMGAFGSIRSAISGEKGLIDLIRDGSGTLKNVIGKFAGGNAGDANDLLASAAAKAALSSININTDPNQMITRATGRAVNPNLELLFAGPKLRSFQFTFQFAPQNIEDASVTRRIMRFFKQGMLPSRALSSDLFLMSPNVFRLSFMNGQDKIRSLNSFKICALTSCQIDFTPDGTYQAYDDPSVISQPVRSMMTLGFTELSPIFWDDYEGSNRASVTELQSTIRDEGPDAASAPRETGNTTVTAADDIGY